jgi:hypothetical protein
VPKSQNKQSKIAPLRVDGLCPFLSLLTLHFTARKEGDGVSTLSSATVPGLYFSFAAYAKPEYSGPNSADREARAGVFQGHVGGWQ